MNKAKGIGLLIAASLLLVGIINTCSKSEKLPLPNENGELPANHPAAQQQEPDKQQTGDIIKLEPGDIFTLETSSNEWTPWIDASHKGMRYNVNFQTSTVFQFLDGSTLEAAKGDTVRLQDVFRMKTQNGKSTIAIQGSMDDINEGLFPEKETD